MNAMIIRMPKGYGFIQPDNGGKDVFVHISAVEKAGFIGLAEGTKISYEVVSDRGKELAGNLRSAELPTARRFTPSGRSAQRSCSWRTSRSFFEAMARSIARSASATASDLVAAWPVRGFASIETAHFHNCRPIP